MATKKPSLTTQLRVAKEQNKALEERVQELEKKLSSAESIKSMYQTNAAKAEEELEAVHDFLDAMPNSIERTYTKQGAWSETKRTAVTRLSAWLVMKDTPIVKSTFEATN